MTGKLKALIRVRPGLDSWELQYLIDHVEAGHSQAFAKNALRALEELQHDPHGQSVRKVSYLSNQCH
jgi:hypothetical protein